MTGANPSDWLILCGALFAIASSLYCGKHGIWRRILYTASVLLGASLLVTGILRLVPGDPIDSLLGDQAPDYARLVLAKDLGLVDENGDPIGFVGQYGRFIRTFAQGDLVSFRTREPVTQMILGKLPYTLLLAALALCFSLAFGPFFGVLAALRRGKRTDTVLKWSAIVLTSIPRFALAPILILIFSLNLEWFPVSGLDDGLRSFILPCLCLGLAMAAVQSRVLRASILDTINEDYIRTARAKGASIRRVYFKHALYNALLPLITLVGLEAGALLTGAVIIEKIFNLPGIGLMLLEGIQQIDLPVVQALVLVISFIYVATNIATELVYQLADPRVRGESE